MKESKKLGIFEIIYKLKMKLKHEKYIYEYNNVPTNIA